MKTSSTLLRSLSFLQNLYELRKTYIAPSILFFFKKEKEKKEANIFITNVRFPNVCPFKIQFTCICNMIYLQVNMYNAFHFSLELSHRIVICNPSICLNY